MKIAIAVARALGNPEGIRFFENEEAARNGGADIATLKTLQGVFVQWPEAAGEFPTGSDVVRWLMEYEAAEELAEKKRLAIDAMLEQERNARLAALANDASAPAAVREYFAAVQ